LALYNGTLLALFSSKVDRRYKVVTNGSELLLYTTCFKKPKYLVKV